MTKKQKKELKKIILAAVLLVVSAMAAHVCKLPWWASLAVYLVPYLFAGYDVLKSAVTNIGHGQIFDEKFLMAIATLGALAIGEYPEAVFVMLFFRVGELFEKVAVGKSRRSISALMDIRPDHANVERAGTVETVDPSGVAVGEIIVVRPGEKVPLDGEIIEGKTALDTSALTGESLPRSAGCGEEIISGCVCLDGVVRVRVSRPFGQSTVSKIMELVENCSLTKAKTENFITRFARVYTPIVVACAVLLALVPPIFVGGWSEWIGRALIFLVVSCPCALVISVPLTFFGGIGGAGKLGVLVKGAGHLEMLSKIRTVVFDKTGTLTCGKFAVTAVHPVDIAEDELLRLAAAVEAFSTHPIAVSLREAAPDAGEATDVREISGHGVTGNVDGKTVAVGNHKLMAQVGADCEECDLVGTVIHVAVNGRYVGHIIISDQIKSDAPAAIAALHQMGLKTVMLTGDRKEVGEAVAKELGLDEVHTELLPEDKVTRVEALLNEGKLAFVGDGINDAPVLTRADLGIAMGAMGSDAAIEAADVVLMDDAPSKITAAIVQSRRTRKIVVQNIVFALGIKVLVMVLAAVGVANMWLASFADVGVSVIAILNATRALHIKK